MDRIVNKNLLGQMIEDLGEGGLVKLHLKSLVGLSTIEKLRAGSYKSKVTRKTRKCLCDALGVPEDLLFPFTDGSNKAS